MLRFCGILLKLSELLAENKPKKIIQNAENIKKLPLPKGGNGNGKTKHGRGMKRKLSVFLSTMLALKSITIHL